MTHCSFGAQRLKRVFVGAAIRIEFEKCEKCGGSVRIIASIEDPDVIENILKHLTAIRAASVAMTGLFIALTASLPGVTLISPVDPQLRGSQVSLRHPDVFAVMQALIERGVIGDFRETDMIRFGFAPLYNNLDEVRVAAAILAEVPGSGVVREARYRRRQLVT